jgi:hypothetical protein
MESRSVVDSGVALSPCDEPKSTGDGIDGDAEGEGEDEDAEGEDDPTATAESTPVIPQLPVLTPLPTVPTAEPVPPSVVGETCSAEIPAPVLNDKDSIALTLSQEQVPVTQREAAPSGDQEPQVQIAQPTSLGLDAGGDLPNLGQSSIEQSNEAQQESSSGPMLGTEPQSVVPEPQVRVPEDVQMEDASIASVAAPEPAPISIPDGQVALPDLAEPQPIPENIHSAASQPEVDPTSASTPELDSIPAPTLISVQDVPVLQAPSTFADSSAMDEIAASAIPAELPAVQGMDMYTNTATPNEQETEQLLTETDLVLANTGLALATGDMGLVNGLGGVEMSLVGEEAAIPGGGLEIPTENLEPLNAPVQSESVPAIQEIVNNTSSRADTPNGGGDDIFAFWNA